MTILVFGKTGQVATELGRIGGVTRLGRDAADLTNPEGCAKAIHAHNPSAVINAAAYTAVDKAEEEPELAQMINGAAPGAMADACAELKIPLVHISTDYVFDGSGDQPWPTDAPTAPLGAYGASKLAGEKAVRGASDNHVILRTSWVFSAHGTNFVKTMLRVGADREALTIVDDQIGGPTPARAIAETALNIAKARIGGAGAPGTYHLSGAPDVSWADFARVIFDLSGLEVTVTDILSSDYPTPAQRPGNSRLDCTTLETVFGQKRPDWKAGLREVLAELDHLKTREISK